MGKAKDEMQPEYRREELGLGTRGKYFGRVSRCASIVRKNPGLIAMRDDKSGAKSKGSSAVPSKAKPRTPVQLRADEAMRNFQADLLESVRQMKAGVAAAVYTVPVEARERSAAKKIRR